MGILLGTVIGTLLGTTMGTLLGTVMVTLFGIAGKITALICNNVLNFCWNLKRLGFVKSCIFLFSLSCGLCG